MIFDGQHLARRLRQPAGLSRRLLEHEFDQHAEAEIERRKRLAAHRDAVTIAAQHSD